LVGGGNGDVSDGGSLICCEGEAKDEGTDAEVVFLAYSVLPGDYFIMGQRAPLSRLTPEQRAALREGHLPWHEAEVKLLRLDKAFGVNDKGIWISSMLSCSHRRI
jgi:hypothetical protein